MDTDKPGIAVVAHPWPAHPLQACHDCDLLQRIPEQENGTFRCSRCNAVLYHALPGRLNKALAMNLAAIVFFMLANAFPVAAIQLTGNTVYATMFGVANALHTQNMNLVALLVIATTIVFPGLDLFCTCTLLLFAKWRRLSETLTLFFRVRSAIKPWSMVEIFVLGTLVAIVKLGSIADIVPEIGFWSLCTFIVLSSATSQAFDPVEFWSETYR